MPHVLVVDDETAMRELLYDALSRRGFQVATAISGPQALEMLKTHRPQLLVIDSTMPGLSGLETVRRVREFDTALPILFLKAPGEMGPSDQERATLDLTQVMRKELGVELFIKALDHALKALEDAPPAAARAGRPTLPGLLLVVDDEPKIQRLLKAFFESRGLRVVTAGSGEEALQALSQKPMAVLLDVNMPGMDGLMTLKKIRAAQASLPVIMASGVGEEGTVRDALGLGAYDYVTKPFNLDYLETVVLTKILLGMEG